MINEQLEIANKSIQEIDRVKIQQHHDDMTKKCEVLWLQAHAYGNEKDRLPDLVKLTNGSYPVHFNLPAGFQTNPQRLL